MTSTTTCEFSNPWFQAYITGFPTGADDTVWLIEYDPDYQNTYPTFNRDVDSFAWQTETCVTEGTTQIIDVGTSFMLGGLMAILIAYWIVGLSRSKWKA